MTNFAAQAVIAIENTRLLSELRELLQQQTATSEVLEVISSSPGELEPVFNAMLKNATRICEAKLGSLFLYEGDRFRAVAVHGDSFYADWSRREPDLDMRDSLHKGTPLERLTRTKAILHIPDLRADEGYLSGNPRVKALVESAGARTHLVVPMLKDDEFVGAIVIYRQEVRPFSDKQIELITNFAAQAVIAIENTRLLKELRQRTDDLSRVAGAADCDIRDSQRHQPARRPMCSRYSTRSPKARCAFSGPSRRQSRALSATWFILPPSLEEAKMGSRRCKAHSASSASSSGIHSRVVEYGRAHVSHRYRERSRCLSRRQGIGARQGLSQHPGRADAAQGRRDRHDWRHAARSWRIRRPPYRSAQNICRPGGDRDRKRQTFQRSAEAHRRSIRIAAAADRHRRCAEGHQPVRPLICERCSTRFCIPPRAFARPIRARLLSARAIPSIGRSPTAFRPLSRSSSRIVRSSRGATPARDAPCWRARSSISPTSKPTRITPGKRLSGLAASAPCSASRCCARAFRSAF